MKRLRAWPLMCGSLAALLGLALGSLGIANALIISLCYLVLVSFLGFLFVRFANTAARWWLIMSLIMALSVLYASLRVATFPVVTQETELKGARAIVVSTVVGAEESEQFYADILDQVVRTRVKVTLRAIQPFRYGDVIVLDGNLVPPRDSATFNESGFLRAHGAHGRLLAMSAQVTGERIGNRALIVIHDFRSWLLKHLHGIAEPERQIVAGIVLGDATAMPARIQDAFRQTGTTHMLVASGANVAILAWMIERILAGFGRRAGLILTGIVIIAFAVIAGGEASIVRAVVLYLILILAKLSGRRVHVPTILAAVALGMVAWNPWTLLFNASFQLSFAAIVGLMTLSNWFATWLPTWWLKEFLAPTLAAEVATLPILLFSFGQLSLIAPVINLVAVPLVMPIMVGGVATLIVPEFRLFIWATEGVTTLLLWMVSSGARVPWASATTDSHRWLASASAVALFAILLILRYRSKPKLAEADVE